MRIVVLAVAVLLAGCGTIGHSHTYLVQSKKELLEFYEKSEKVPSPDERTAAQKERAVAERAVSLRKIYGSNLPLSLTDAYDTRTAAHTPIRAGEPLNILINKVRVKENKQRAWLLENSADIAVVVTVDDGKSGEPKHVIVAYETNVGKSTKLPDDDLLAYSTERYNDEPVRIEVTVLALYGSRNKTYTEILSAAAGIGAAMSPAYAPAISAASQVGKALINAKQDNVISRFTFQLYPWKVGGVRHLDQLGVPRVAYGQYLLVNAETPEEVGDPSAINLDYHFTPYRVGLATKAVGDDLDAGRVPRWPLAGPEAAPAQRVDVTYVVLTVDNTKLNSAKDIIARADAANRALAQLATDAVPTLGRVQFVASQLDDLKSKIRLQAATSDFSRHKRDPAVALGQSLATVKDTTNGLSDGDRAELLQEVRNMLPPGVSAADRKDADTLLAWLAANQNRLMYNATTGRYCFAAADGKGCDLTKPL